MQVLSVVLSAWITAVTILAGGQAMTPSAQSEFPKIISPAVEQKYYLEGTVVEVVHQGNPEAGTSRITSGFPIVESTCGVTNGDPLSFAHCDPGVEETTSITLSREGAYYGFRLADDKKGGGAILGQLTWTPKIVRVNSLTAYDLTMQGEDSIVVEFANTTDLNLSGSAEVTLINTYNGNQLPLNVEYDIPANSSAQSSILDLSKVELAGSYLVRIETSFGIDAPSIVTIAKYQLYLPAVN